MFTKGKDQEIAELREQVEQLQAALTEKERQLVSMAAGTITGPSLVSTANEPPEILRLRQALLEARDKLAQQEALLRRLTQHPIPYATVIGKGVKPYRPEEFKPGIRVEVKSTGKIGTVGGPAQQRGYVVVNFGNEPEGSYRIGLADVDGGERDLDIIGRSSEIVVISFEDKPIEVAMPRNMTIEPGDTVKLSQETMQIIGVVGKLRSGEIASVYRIVDAQACEVDHQDTRRVVYSGKFGGKLEVGDRVVLDKSATVIVENLGKKEDRFIFAEDVNTTWDDIGGLEEAKDQMREVIELPFKERARYQHYRKRPVHGVMFYGPPGCGKTLLAKATATALAGIYNGDRTISGFLYIKGPEILTRYVGDSELIIRQVFARARKHKKEKGYPAVIFIDEAEAILRKRGTGISSDVEATVVPMFLAEMDGLEETGAIVILATNRPDILDPAVVRDGRIDRKIMVPRPDRKSTAAIFALHLRDIPLSNGFSAAELSEFSSDEIFSDKYPIYQVMVNGQPNRIFTLAHIVNGGMIASIVDQATSLAIKRDVSAGGFTGLKREELTSAIAGVHRQNLNLDHTDELREFVYDFKDSVQEIRKLCQAAS